MTTTPEAGAHTAPIEGPIAAGSGAYWRASVALFFAAFSVFAAIYCVQPILPVFAAEYGLDAAASSAALSSTTAALALSLLVVSWLGNRLDRKALMAGTLVATGVLTLAVPAAGDWGLLVGLRALVGVAVCGVPAIAMVYLGEEMAPEALGGGMGLFVGGSAVGGMAGRLLMGGLSDVLGWRPAMALFGLAILVLALAFIMLLPAPQRSGRQVLSLPHFSKKVAGLFADKALPLLFACSFLLMGGFVAVYNYVGFRLLAPPYGLGQHQIALIFIVYLVGTLGSAWMGALAGRLGRRKMLWPMIVLTMAGMAITVLAPLWAVVLGVAVMTFGFFGAHSIASAWVARRAQDARAQGSAVYLLAYYAGSSVIGTLGGYGWSHWGWPGVLAFSAGAAALALIASWRLAVLPPLLPPLSAGSRM